MKNNQTSIPPKTPPVLDNVVAGLTAGLFAGAVMGAFLVASGVMARAVEKFGGPSLPVGFVMHMFFSGVMGAVFGLCLGRLIKTYRGAVLGAVMIGAFFWVFGVVVVAPLRFGTPASIDSAMSTLHILIGHSLFGTIMGVIFLSVRRVIRTKMFFRSALTIAAILAASAIFILTDKAFASPRPAFSDVFFTADANNDGRITKEELATTSIPSFIQRRIFARADINEDGAISIDERFESFDENRDGNITSSEIPAAFRQKFFEDNDTNGDGMVTQKELHEKFANDAE